MKLARLAERYFEQGGGATYALANKIRNRIRGFRRQHYLFCIQHSARLAAALGEKRVSILE